MKYQTLIRTTATLYLLMAVLGCTGTKEAEETKEVEEMVSEEFLRVDKKVIFVAKTATESRFTISSTQHWQLGKPNTGAEWITNIAADNGTSDASSITGENDTFITITTTTNPNDAGRNTKLTLRAIDQAGKALTYPSSITIPFTQLGTTYTGNVIVRTQAQVNALRNLLTGTTRIVGNLTIGPKEGKSDISDLSPFATITEITGNVIVQSNPDLPNLMGLNQLQSIGGSFKVGGGYSDGNGTLTSLGNFSSLQTIGGRFGVSYNATLTSLGDFSALQSIGDSFEMSWNGSLISLGDFSALQSIGSDFSVGYNHSLTFLGDFPLLQSIRGSFYVRQNSALISLRAFPMLASIGSNQDGVSIKVTSNYRLQDCCALTEFLSGAINAVSGKVFINYNAPGCNSTTQVNCNSFLQVVQKVVFAAKTVGEGTLEIFSRGYWQLSKPNTGAEWITNIAADGGNSDVSSITGENYAFITITTTVNPNDAGRSTTLTLRAIDQAGNALTDPAPITIPFTQLGTTHTGSIILESQADVNALVLPANVTAIQGVLAIGSEGDIGNNSDITDLRPLSGITHVGRIEVTYNYRLVSLGSLGNLQFIGDSFDVWGNISLTSLGDFPTLQAIGNRFEVDDNAALTSLGDFTALQSTGGSFGVSSNDALTSLGDFPSLQSIGGSFEVKGDDAGNASLTSLGDFSTLKSIGRNFRVSNNNGITSLGDFSSLQSIGGYFSVSSNNALPSLGDFPALQTIRTSFSVSNNATLTSLGDFPSLQSIGGSFYVSNNDALTSLGAFPMLASIGSADRIKVPSTDNNQDDVSIVVEDNALLQDCCVLTTFLSGAKNAVSGKAFINNNATGCSSEVEIKPCAGGGSTTKGK